MSELNAEGSPSPYMEAESCAEVGQRQWLTGIVMVASPAPQDPAPRNLL